MRKRGELEAFKIVSNAPFLVDEFRFPNYNQTTHYFLSHFHGDHYMGLDAEWNGGLIYSGEATLRLVQTFLGVDSKFCRPLPFEERVDLGSDRFVTLHDAFHCPGAAVFVFDLPPLGFDKRRRFVIHTGDFRFESSQMRPWVEKLKCQSDTHYIDAIYLDTTYCRPGYSFPLQETVLQRIQMIVRHQKSLPGNTAFVVPTYNIGKEKVLKAVCDAAESTAFVDDRKMHKLKLLALPYSSIYDSATPQCVFTSDWSVGTSPGDLFNKTEEVWIRLSKLRDKLSQIVQTPASLQQPPASLPFTRLVTIVSTGWTWSKPTKLAWSRTSLEPTLCNDDRSLAVYRVPYSEHSSYAELLAFVELCRPRRVVPTVGNAQSREKQLSHFTNLVDRAAADKEAFMQLFKQPTQPPPTTPAPTSPEYEVTTEYEDSEVRLTFDSEGDLKQEESFFDGGSSNPPSIVDIEDDEPEEKVHHQCKRSLQQKSLADFLVKKKLKAEGDD